MDASLICPKCVGVLKRVVVSQTPFAGGTCDAQHGCAEIFGEGEDRTELVSRAKQRGVEDRVAFAGFLSNPWAHFAGADAFLLPSRWEGMPNAALESLAVGTPVVARSEAGGVTEIGGVALTIVENDQAFAAAMAGVRPRSDLKLRASILPQRFALDSVMREFEALLSRVGAGEPLTD